MEEPIFQKCNEAHSLHSFYLDPIWLLDGMTCFPACIKGQTPLKYSFYAWHNVSYKKRRKMKKEKRFRTSRRKGRQRKKQKQGKTNFRLKLFVSIILSQYVVAWNSSASFFCYFKNIVKSYHGRSRYFFIIIFRFHWHTFVSAFELNLNLIHDRMMHNPYTINANHRIARKSHTTCFHLGPLKH